MTVRVSQQDYDAAADLAALAERICFGGNDVAGLRNGIAGDNNILEFVRLVAKYRVAVLEQAARVARSEAIKTGSQTRRTAGLGLKRDAYFTEIAGDVFDAIRDLI